MMDNFKEDIVSSHNQLLSNILYVLCWIFVVIFALYALLLLQVLLIAFNIVTVLMVVLSGAGAVWLFYIKDHLKLEYEYTFTNGTLDFAKVYRSSRRKDLATMNVQNVLACGHVAHPSFQRYLQDREVKRRNWFLNRDGNLVYFYYVRDNQKNMVIIEPSEEMVTMIRRYLQAGVYQG